MKVLYELATEAAHRQIVPEHVRFSEARPNGR
jgi:hypothetical protein